MKIFFIMILSFILFQNFLFAETTIDLQLKGVWRGTIGKQEVMVCFDDFDSNYYYLRYFKGILLRQSDDGEWKEFALAKRQHLDFDHPTGYWKLDKITDRRLTVTGEWTDPETKRTESIELNRVNPAPSKWPGCSGNNDLSRLFNHPRVQAQKITKGEIQVFEGKYYRELSTLKGQSSDIRTVELLEGEKGIHNINEFLHKKLLTDIERYFDCGLAVTIFSYSPFGGAPFEVDYRIYTKPFFWDTRRVSLMQESFITCNERRNAFVEFLTFDSHTGEQINLWNWIKDSNGNRPPEKLSRLIVSKKQGADDESCFHDEDEYGLALEKEGMFFAHISLRGDACEGVGPTIPYPDLLPFLTNEGKAAVKSIMAESEKK